VLLRRVALARAVLRRGAGFTAASADTLHISEGLLRKATDQVAAEMSSVSALFA